MDLPAVCSHPQLYETAVVFDIHSDWAEFNLLSPDSIILPDLNNPYPTDTVASGTRIRWGRERSHDYKRQTLRFFVINDGSPINFSISHGSDGATRGKGRAEAIIEAACYLNEGVTDNVWNTKWFYQKPVSAKAASTTLEVTQTPHKWNDLLQAYLKEIGTSDSL